MRGDAPRERFDQALDAAGDAQRAGHGGQLQITLHHAISVFKRQATVRVLFKDFQVQFAGQARYLRLARPEPCWSEVIASACFASCRAGQGKYSTTETMPCFQDHMVTAR